MKEGTRVLVGLAAGLAIGFAVSASHDVRVIAIADNVGSIGSIWISAVRMTIIPLVVALLVTGVASAASTTSVGRIGVRTIVVFAGLLCGAALVIAPIAMAAFAWLGRMLPDRPPLPAGAAEAAASIATSTQPTSLLNWLVALVPTNPIAAAANGAMLQVILFAFLLALAIGSTPIESRTILIGFFRALNDAMLVLVRWIVLLAPIGVFALMVPLGAHGGGGLVGAIGFYVVTYSAGALLIVLLLYPVVRALAGTSMKDFARAALPSQLVAFGSSSSVATLPVMVEATEGTLQLSPRVTGFVLPVAVSTFKIAAPVSWTVGALFVGWFYHVSLGPAQVAIIAGSAVLLSGVAPGVPRGAFLMLAPLFTAIGLPVEGIGVLIAVDAIPDLFATVLNVTGDMAATTLVARWER